jgi:GT2 family glycosyltransferase
VNNDATVDPGWLRPLVAALEPRGDRVGAVCPKMLFDGRYVEARLDVPDAARIGTDPRTLGVRLIGARIDGRRDDRRLAFDEGWFGDEPPSRPAGEEIARWSWRRGRLRVRVDDELPTELSVHLTSPTPRHATIATGKEEVIVALDGETGQWTTIALDDDALDVINNAGSALYANGFGGDRGFLERDSGQFDEPADVFAWCGGAVLLAKAYLDEVGLFDERLFLYYEDTDLSWRGRLRGWRYVYEPTSLVRHRHAASSGGSGSGTFRYYTERNRVLMLAKNAPAGLALRQGLGLVKRAIGVNIRDLVVRPLTLHGPLREHAGHQRRVLVGYLRLLPAMLRDRWRPGRRVRRRDLMSWTITKDTAR